MKIYFIGIILITLLVIILYVMNDQNHQKEMEKILAYEAEESELEKIRRNTTPCPYDNLCNPRDCYFKSNYRCSWNGETRRCELRV